MKILSGFGIHNKHRDIGKSFSHQKSSGAVIEGICDMVEIQPAHYVSTRTGMPTAYKKIRLRLRPAFGRAVWTEWFPYGRAK